MIVVVIAGGSGTRLWPLSTHDQPKHLLKLTNERSLLQNTYDRVSELSQDIFVVPEASHAGEVYEQLPEVPKQNFLVEPARRGTASCVILALSQIKKAGLSNQAILFLWGDHLIRDRQGFARAARQVADLAEATKKLVFLGVEPTYPSTGFGYIHKGDSINNGFKNAYELKQFVEKPDKERAEHFFESGEYLWNMGYLTGTLETFEREIQEHAARLWGDYQQLLESDDPKKIYMDFEGEAIDTALSEHVPDALVVPGTFDWIDIGSFQDLHGVSHQDEKGNHIKGAQVMIEHTSNSYIQNEKDTPLAVVGLDNIVVVVNGNGILVANKNYAQAVGDVAKKVQAGKSKT